MSKNLTRKLYHGGGKYNNKANGTTGEHIFFQDLIYVFNEWHDICYKKIKTKLETNINSRGFLFNLLNKVHADIQAKLVYYGSLSAFSAVSESGEKYSDTVIKYYHDRLDQITFFDFKTGEVNINTKGVIEKYTNFVYRIISGFMRFKNEGFSGKSKDVIDIRIQLYNIVDKFIMSKHGFSGVPSKNGKDKKPEMILNIIIMGSAGTGKTKLADAIADFLYSFCILHRYNPSTKDNPSSPDDPVTCVRFNIEDIISKWQGDTSKQMANFFNKNIEHTLFLDEIYKLTPKGGDGADKGRTDVVDQLVITLDRLGGLFSIIGAGYEIDTVTFLKSNEGLDRRFPLQIFLKPYALSSFTDRITSTITRTYEEDINKSKAEDIRKIVSYINGITVMYLSAIYPDFTEDNIFLNSNKTILKYLNTREKQRFIQDEVNKTSANNPENFIFDYNLTPLLNIMKKAFYRQKREVLFTYILTVKFQFPHFNLIKAQQDTIEKIINNILSNDIISPMSLNSEGKTLDIDILDVLNTIFNESLSSMYGTMVTVDMGVRNAGHPQVNKFYVDVLFSSLGKNFAESFKAVISSDSEINKLYTEALLYHYITLTRFEAAMDKKSVKKIPEVLDSAFIKGEFFKFNQKNSGKGKESQSTFINYILGIDFTSLANVKLNPGTVIPALDYLVFTDPPPAPIPPRKPRLLLKF